MKSPASTPFRLTAAVGLLIAIGASGRLGLPKLEIIRSGVFVIPLAWTLVALAAMAGTWRVARGRVRGHAGRSARLGQLISVVPVALAGAWLAWRAHLPGAMQLATPSIYYALGAAAIALSFPLVIAERQLAAARSALLPEAGDLRLLTLLAAAACFAAGVLEIAAGFGLPYTPYGMTALALLAAGVGAELAVRTLLKLFLPPPDEQAARAATFSLLAKLIATLMLGGKLAEGGIAAPIRSHFGIDFSRSWALAYVRAAIWPLALGMGALAWGLSGVVLVPLDARAVYQRFGAPVAVLHPGLHLMLPWPFGTARRVEFGAVHDIGLNGIDPTSRAAAAAEDLAPASADRLWESPHAGEITLTIASLSGTRQSFQTVSADLRLLYRVGLTDSQALAATYSAADPQALVQAAGGRAIADYFASRTLDQVLGAHREAMAAEIGATIQAALDRAHSGLEMVAVVIEAIHPPAGAADAYHYVRAAEIAARSRIASERGNAIVIRSQSRQYATDHLDAARGGEAEMVGAARVQQTRFAADQQAAKAGGRAFLLERYFSSLSQALAKTPMTVIDHRLNWPEAPVLDLRPLAGALPTNEKAE